MHSNGHDDAASGPRLRPYLITSGRARPIDDSLALEAQVAATSSGTNSAPGLTFEHRDIVLLCQRPLSVAEVGARLGLHVGVVRVLVADLAALGHLEVHNPTTGIARDAQTIERVIRGLETLR